MICCALCGVGSEGRRGEVCAEDLNGHLLYEGFDRHQAHLWVEAVGTVPDVFGTGGVFMEVHRNVVADALEKFVQPTRVPWTAVIVGAVIVYLLARVVPGLAHWHPGF